MSPLEARLHDGAAPMEDVIAEVTEQPPIIAMKDAIRLGVWALGTAIGLGAAHYVDRKLDNRGEV